MGFYRNVPVVNCSQMDLVPGCVTRFPHTLSLKVPHMGWNQLQIQRDSRLLDNLPVDSSAYFVHSYYCDMDDPKSVVATAEYGLNFCAVAAQGSVAATQFHPEKSGPAGLRIYDNFCRSMAGLRPN